MDRVAQIQDVVHTSIVILAVIIVAILIIRGSWAIYLANIDRRLARRRAAAVQQQRWDRNNHG